MYRVVFLSLSLMISSLAIGQSQRAYQRHMKGGIELLNSTETEIHYALAAQTFQQAEGEYPEEWLPGYYLAYTHIMQSFDMAGGTVKDSLLDLAQAAIDRATAIQAEESELLVLQAYLYQARIQVDMANRGPEMTMHQRSALFEAEQLNPDNPRIYLLRGQNTWFMPAFFGGGAEAAKPSILTAREKYAAFEAPSEIWPSWGEERLEYFLEQYDLAE